MPNKERFFPLSTVGGRIQERRHALNLSRSELYDKVYNNDNGSAGSDSSKEKTVYNWESEKTQLNYETIKDMCKVLKCSSDYLLGLETCTNRDNEFIHKKTGLSESNIELLANWKSNSNKQGQGYDWARNSIKALNGLLDCDCWFYDAVLNQIANYCYYRTEYEHNEELDNHQRTEYLRNFNLAIYTANNGLRDCIERHIYPNINKAPGTD